jgi:thiosulfate/3-mercaptopyruvate sulfurtransferase
MNEDGAFEPPAELRALYEGEGFVPEKEVIAYCRIGERFSHTWFVLTYLLGYPNVRNYDGSWTETHDDRSAGTCALRSRAAR